ncbi:MAG: phosphotransferase [Candidatus Pacearchaeota archaeon]
MKFEDYKKLHECFPLEKTEQSWTFVFEENGERRVVKRYPSEFDRLREELAYSYINHFNLLRIPNLISSGEDFVAMDFLESIGCPSLEESIEGISKMYLTTLNDSKPKGYFPRIDLTKDKLHKRLEYLPLEVEKRGIKDKDLFEKSERFVNERYVVPEHYCLIHGDLKSPHIIKTINGIFFIDLALVSVANPWYDLAFLYMEKKNKGKVLLDTISNKAFEFLGRDFSVNKEDIKDLLHSAIFYRSLYDVGFAARHRTDKTLRRTIRDLYDIIKH